MTADEPARQPTSPPPTVAVEDATIQIDGTTIVHDASLLAPAGGLTTIIGPNGSGKSTVLRAIYRALRPSRGTALIGDRDVWSMSAKQNARTRAVVTQHHGETADFTVSEIVAMGRTPHKGYLDGDTRADRTIIATSLQRVGMSDFSDRYFQDLSGGERQRVLLARALAQQAPAILLDEPTNHLDVNAQFSLLDLLRDLEATIVVALHDLNHALTYSDHVVVMDQGRIYAAGVPATVITPPLLRDVFRVSSCVVHNPLTNSPQILFGGSADDARDA